MNERVVALLAMPLHEADALGRAAGPVRLCVRPSASPRPAHTHNPRASHMRMPARTSESALRVFSMLVRLRLLDVKTAVYSAPRDTYTPIGTGPRDPQGLGQPYG